MIRLKTKIIFSNIWQIKFKQQELMHQIHHQEYEFYYESMTKKFG